MTDINDIPGTGPRWQEKPPTVTVELPSGKKIRLECYSIGPERANDGSLTDEVWITMDSFVTKVQDLIPANRDNDFLQVGNRAIVESGDYAVGFGGTVIESDEEQFRVKLDLDELGRSEWFDEDDLWWYAGSFPLVDDRTVAGAEREARDAENDANRHAALVARAEWAAKRRWSTTCPHCGMVWSNFVSEVLVVPSHQFPYTDMLCPGGGMRVIADMYLVEG